MNYWKKILVKSERYDNIKYIGEIRKMKDKISILLQMDVEF